MDLTIVIVNYNVCYLLRQCLKSVSKASIGIDCEIYVVDNNSSDASCSMISEEFPEVRLISNTFNAGYSYANNQALRLARGKYVLLLNPDTIIDNDSLYKCLRFMESHADAGAMGVKMVNGDGEYLPESKRSFPSMSSAFFKSFGFSYLFPVSRIFNRYYLMSVGTEETSKTEVISGAFMLIRKEVLSVIGLLDEDFFMYGEDIDLSYRIVEAGFSNYYFPEVEITHFKGCSTPRDNYYDLIHFYKAMRTYVRKRYSEGKFRYSYLLLISGIYLREILALINRFIGINVEKYKILL